MPKIKTVSRSAAFVQLHDATRELHENNDCGVKAVAVLAGVEYSVAHKACAPFRKHGKGMYAEDVRKVLRNMGFSVSLVNEQDFIDRYPGQHKDLKHVTTYHPIRFKGIFNNGRNYMMFTHGHVAAMTNGEVHDWSNGRALRVEGMWEVTKK